jgi:hypothetical protein
MYNTKVICTYNTTDVFLESDNITEKDKEFIRDAIYRQELLDILNITEYNETNMSDSMHQLYEQIKDCNELNECIIKLAGHFNSIDKEFGLMILYSFDYMYLTHICISEFLKTGKINGKNITKLKAIVF